MTIDDTPGLRSYNSNAQKQRIKNDQVLFSAKEITKALNYLNAQLVPEHRSKEKYVHTKSAVHSELEEIGNTHGVNGLALQYIMEEGYHLKPTTKDIIKDNVTSFAVSATIAYISSALDEPLLDSKELDSVAKAAGWTVLSDLLQYFAFPKTKGNIRRTMADDLGTFAGYLAGKLSK